MANDGDTRGADVKCCIGTEAMGCKAPSRQGKGNNKASKAKRSSLFMSELALGRKEAAKDHVKVDSPALKAGYGGACTRPFGETPEEGEGETPGSWTSTGVEGHRLSFLIHTLHARILLRSDVYLAGSSSNS